MDISILIKQYKITIFVKHVIVVLIVLERVIVIQGLIYVEMDFWDLEKPVMMGVWEDVMKIVWLCQKDILVLK